MVSPTSTDRARLAEIALSQDGVREEGGNNCGPKVREYQAATWLAPGPWPWCAAFVDWVVREWLKTVDRSASILAGLSPESWRPKTAGAFDLINWATSRHMKTLKGGAPTEAGDIVVFDMSHCGIVSADHGASIQTLKTVEGNTGPAGKRDSESGDGVFRKKRDRSMVRNLIRLELT